MPDPITDLLSMPDLITDLCYLYFAMRSWPIPRLPFGVRYGNDKNELGLD